MPDEPSSSGWVSQLVSWDIGSAEPPGTRLVFPTVEPWEGFLSGNASPTEDLTVHVGAGPYGPWVRTVDGEGDFELLPSSALLDGVPFGVAFTPDGKLLNVLVEAPSDGGVAASPWRLVQIDPSGGPPRDTGIAATLPLAEPGLTADISEDVSVAVVWSDPRQAILVDLATGRQVPVTPPPRDASLNFYRALSSGAAALWDDGAVTLFDRTGHVAQELGGHRAPVRDVALAPDESWAVTVAERGEVLLWDVDPATGRWSMREFLTGHTGDVLEVEIDPEGSHVVTVSPDNRVIVWDVGPDGGFGTSHPGLPGRWMANGPEDVEPGRLVVAPTRSLDPQGQSIPYLGEGTLDAAATFLDPRTGEVVEQVDVGSTVEDAVFGVSVAVSPDRGLVAVTSGLGVTVLDTATRDVVQRLDLPDGFYCSAEWTPDGIRLLLGHEGQGCWAQDTSTEAGDILVVDVATWEVVDRQPLDVLPEFMELGPDDRSLVVLSGNSPELVILDVTTLEEMHRVSLDVDERFWDVAFSPNGRLLVGGGEFGRLHVVDLDTWEAREAVSDPRRAVAPARVARRSHRRLHRDGRHRAAVRRRACGRAGVAAARVRGRRPWLRALDHGSGRRTRRLQR